MKFIATTSEKLNSIEIKSGQMIFSQDERVIYLDAGTQRTSYQSIIILVNEDQRKNAVSPVSGFYFVEETSELWRYKNNNWTPINVKVDGNIIFVDNMETMPAQGVEKVLYVNGETNITYRWDNQQNKYIPLNTQYWDEMN